MNRPEHIDLNEVQFTPELLERVPRWAARKYHTLPVSISPDALGLAIEDPRDLDVVDKLEFLFERKVIFSIAESSQLRVFLNRLYPPTDPLYPPIDA